MLLWKGMEIPAGMTGHDAGRLLLADLYHSYTGKALPEITAAERGKPCFVSETLEFSISHTPRHVFCALSDRPVGIDAEEADRPTRLELAERILSENEKVRYAAAEDKNLALLSLWVLKEASVKCTGEGLRGFPNGTDFSPDDPRVTVRDGCVVAVVQG